MSDDQRQVMEKRIVSLEERMAALELEARKKPPAAGSGFSVQATRGKATKAEKARFVIIAS